MGFLLEVFYSTEGSLFMINIYDCPQQKGNLSISIWSLNASWHSTITQVQSFLSTSEQQELGFSKRSEHLTAA